MLGYLEEMFGFYNFFIVNYIYFPFIVFGFGSKNILVYWGVNSGLKCNSSGRNELSLRQFLNLQYMSDNCRTFIFEGILFLKLWTFVSLVMGTLKLVNNYSEIFINLK